MSYAVNKVRSRTTNTQPSLTDQSAAKDTDRNVIVKKFMVHGQVPTGNKTPIYADFASMPKDLVGLLEQAKSIYRLKNQLPKDLRDLTLDALLALTPDEIKAKLTPPTPPSANNEGKNQ